MKGLACGVLDLFRVYSPRSVARSHPTTPFSLIAIFRILTPAFLATVTVLGINPCLISS
jgi:hypothetical protein